MENHYNDVWEYRIKKTFEKKGAKDKQDILWEIINLILYQNAKDTIITEIYNLFEDKENFIKLISLLDGRKFTAPTKKELEEAILLSILYYEKEIEGKSWSSIKEGINFKISSIKYGIKIKNLDNWIKQKIQEILRKEGNL